MSESLEWISNEQLIAEVERRKKFHADQLALLNGEGAGTALPRLVYELSGRSIGITAERCTSTPGEVQLPDACKREVEAQAVTEACVAAVSGIAKLPADEVCNRKGTLAERGQAVFHRPRTRKLKREPEASAIGDAVPQFARSKADAINPDAHLGKDRGQD